MNDQYPDDFWTGRARGFANPDAVPFDRLTARHDEYVVTINALRCGWNKPMHALIRMWSNQRTLAWKSHTRLQLPYPCRGGTVHRWAEGATELSGAPGALKVLASRILPLVGHMVIAWEHSF